MLADEPAMHESLALLSPSGSPPATPETGLRKTGAIEGKFCAQTAEEILVAGIRRRSRHVYTGERVARLGNLQESQGVTDTLSHPPRTYVFLPRNISLCSQQAIQSSPS